MKPAVKDGGGHKAHPVQQRSKDDELPKAENRNNAATEHKTDNETLPSDIRIRGASQLKSLAKKMKKRKLAALAWKYKRLCVTRKRTTEQEETATLVVKSPSTASKIKDTLIPIGMR